MTTTPQNNTRDRFHINLPKDEVKKLFKGRFDEGYEICKNLQEDGLDFDSAWDEYIDWNEYNYTLFEHIYCSEQAYRDYKPFPNFSTEKCDEVTGRPGCPKDDEELVEDLRGAYIEQSRKLTRYSRELNLYKYVESNANEVIEPKMTSANSLYSELDKQLIDIDPANNRHDKKESPQKTDVIESGLLEIRHKFLSLVSSPPYLSRPDAIATIPQKYFNENKRVDLIKYSQARDICADLLHFIEMHLVKKNLPKSYKGIVERGLEFNQSKDDSIANFVEKVNFQIRNIDNMIDWWRNNKPAMVSKNLKKESLSKRPSIPKGALNSMKKLILPDMFDLKKLTVYHTEGDYWQIKCNEPEFKIDKVKSYVEIGFESQSPKGKPIKEWTTILKTLAENEGKLNYTKNDRFLPQYIDEVNKRLKEFWGIGYNPIDKKEKKHCYETIFRFFYKQ